MTSPTAPLHRAPTPTLWADKPMPDAERRLLTTLSAGVWLIALAMNVSHVYNHLGQRGIQIDDTRRAVLCLAPDVLLLIGVWKLRYRARSSVAWAMMAAGLAWLAWSALSTAQPTLSARMLAVAPIGVAVLTTLALEFKHAPATTPDGASTTEQVTPSRDGDAVTALALDVVPVKAPIPVPPAPRMEAPEEPAKTKRPAPSREQARAILLALDDFEKVTDAKLAEEHGGSDRFWAGARKRLRGELTAMTTEAGAL